MYNSISVDQSNRNLDYERNLESFCIPVKLYELRAVDIITAITFKLKELSITKIEGEAIITDQQSYIVYHVLRATVQSTFKLSSISYTVSLELFKIVLRLYEEQHDKQTARSKILTMLNNLTMVGHQELSQMAGYACHGLGFIKSELKEDDGTDTHVLHLHHVLYIPDVMVQHPTLLKLGWRSWLYFRSQVGAGNKFTCIGESKSSFEMLQEQLRANNIAFTLKNPLELEITEVGNEIDDDQQPNENISDDAPEEVSRMLLQPFSGSWIFQAMCTRSRPYYLLSPPTPVKPLQPMTMPKTSLNRRIGRNSKVPLRKPSLCFRKIHNTAIDAHSRIESACKESKTDEAMHDLSLENVQLTSSKPRGKDENPVQLKSKVIERILAASQSSQPKPTRSCETANDKDAQLTNTESVQVKSKVIGRLLSHRFDRK